MSKDKFRYSYAAPTQEERREIESIRARYRTDAHAEDLARLRLLDGRVRRIPMLWALLLGIVGVLLFGLGMAIVLEWEQLAGGIAVSAAGILPMAFAAPVHALAAARAKKKYGAEILRLSDALLDEADRQDADETSKETPSAR